MKLGPGRHKVATMDMLYMNAEQMVRFQFPEWVSLTEVTRTRYKLPVNLVRPLMQ